MSNGDLNIPAIDNGSQPWESELTDADLVGLVGMFVDELPVQVAAIEKAMGERDIAALGKLIHQLKGSAGEYEFLSITDAAKVVEAGANADHNLATPEQQTRTRADLCRRARASSSIA